MTPSEQLVFELCKQSFLSMWSYANPRRPDGRELCDALVVFGNRIVIFSVKEIALKQHHDPAIAGQRWVRKAVDDSRAQLLGARREIAAMRHVVRSDGTAGVALPSADQRRVHLLAVAAGGKREVPFAGGLSGDAYAHVVDEIALRELLGELDTASDFIDYLDAKESFAGTIVCEGEENLLAVYLHRGRRFPEMHLLFVEHGSWSELREKPEFAARRAEDRVSYWWDKLVETFIADYGVFGEQGPSPSDHERVVRVMAAENRLSRRILSAACLEWLAKRQPGARTVRSPSGVTYVFGTYPPDWTREHRIAEIGARCFVARGHEGSGPIVIGLATETYDPRGYSFDAFYLDMPIWTDDDDAKAEEARRLFGIYVDVSVMDRRIDEFPSAAEGKELDHD